MKCELTDNLNTNSGDETQSNGLVAASVEVPQWAVGWRVRRIMVVETARLLVRLCEGSRHIVVSLIDTPHYRFIKAYRHSNDMAHAADISGYGQYAMRYIPDSENRVERLSQLYLTMCNTGYLCGDHRFRPILLFRQRPWKRMTVFDGLHRAAVLMAMGQKNITVGIIADARPFWRKVQSWVCRGYRSARENP